MEFSQYEKSCNKIWVYKIQSSYQKINDQIERHSKKRLKTPIFEINPSANWKWGSWSPSDRVMSFSAKLLRNYEWEAVEHVMKHEMAHQIVSEIFNMDCHGVAHGEAWKQACLIVDIEPKRCDSPEFLGNFKGISSSRMVERVRKIIVQANDKAVTEEEADIFMKKAKELMLRHDIEMKDVTGSERVWVTRPFGPLFERWPSYMWTLGSLLSDHYNVKCIRTYGPSMENSWKNSLRLEIFGEPENLDIAEYVGHALLNQAEYLYEEHKKSRQKAKAEGEGFYGKLSKRAYMEGLINAYSEKLDNDEEKAKERVEDSYRNENNIESNYGSNDGTIIPTYNVKLLNEMYGKAYPNMRNITCSGSYGEGRNAGAKAGANLRLSKGVARGSNKGLLNA